MIRVATLAAVLMLAGCGQVRNRADAIDARNATMSEAVRRIVVVPGATVPGHPGYTQLGTVQGYCERTPHGDQQIIHGDNLRQAAYRKYGSRVDAIVNAQAWFVIGAASSSEIEPGNSEGHFECAGTAVSFTVPQAAQ